MSIILADKMLEALESAGLIRVEDRVRRVVIDLQIGHVAVIHVECIGDERLLNIVPGLDGVQVVRESRPDDADASERYSPEEYAYANRQEQAFQAFLAEKFGPTSDFVSAPGANSLVTAIDAELERAGAPVSRPSA